MANQSETYFLDRRVPAHHEVANKHEQKAYCYKTMDTCLHWKCEDCLFAGVNKEQFNIWLSLQRLLS